MREGSSVLAQARRFAEAHGGELTVGAVDWRYVRLGSGPPVLWLTGGLRRAALGFAFLERLALHHTVVAPDYPPVTTFAEFDAGLCAILHAEGIGRCDVVGQSYGGMLAQAFLAAHPDRVRQLVLSSSGPADYGRRWLPVLALAVAVVRVLPRPLLTRLLVRGLSGLLPSEPGPQGEWAAVLQKIIGADLTRPTSCPTSPSPAMWPGGSSCARNGSAAGRGGWLCSVRRMTGPRRPGTSPGCSGCWAGRSGSSPWAQRATRRRCSSRTATRRGWRKC